MIIYPTMNPPVKIPSGLHREVTGKVAVAMRTPVKMRATVCTASVMN